MNDTKDMSDERWRQRFTLALRWFKMSSQVPHALACARGISGVQHQILWALVAHSWARRTRDDAGRMGGNEVAEMSAAAISRQINRDQSHVAAGLRDLEGRQIVSREAGKGYRIDPNYATWRGCFEPPDLARLHDLFGDWVGLQPRGPAQGPSPTLGAQPRGPAQGSTPIGAQPRATAQGPWGPAQGPWGPAQGPWGPALPPSNARAGEVGELGEVGEQDPPTQPNGPNGHPPPPQKQNGQTQDWWDADPDPDPDPDPPQPPCTPEDVAAARARAHAVSDSNRRPARPI